MYLSPCTNCTAGTCGAQITCTGTLGSCMLHATLAIGCIANWCMWYNHGIKMTIKIIIIITIIICKTTQVCPTHAATARACVPHSCTCLYYSVWACARVADISKVQNRANCASAPQEQKILPGLRRAWAQKRAQLAPLVHMGPHNDKMCPKHATNAPKVE